MKNASIRTLAALITAAALPMAAQAATVPYSVGMNSGQFAIAAGAVTFNDFDTVNLTSVATVTGGIQNYGASVTGTGFLSATSSAPITITFTGLQDYFGFYWGSNDAGLNLVSFYNGATLISTQSGNGTSIFTSFTANSSASYFDRVVLSMPSACCFEVDNLASRAVAGATAVPEPGALALVGTGLFLAGAARRRRQG